MGLQQWTNEKAGTIADIIYKHLTGDPEFATSVSTVPLVG
jgi:hypothetical protein